MVKRSPRSSSLPTYSSSDSSLNAVSQAPVHVEAAGAHDASQLRTTGSQLAGLRAEHPRARPEREVEGTIRNEPRGHGLSERAALLRRHEDLARVVGTVQGRHTDPSWLSPSSCARTPSWTVSGPHSPRRFAQRDSVGLPLAAIGAFAGGHQEQDERHQLSTLHDWFNHRGFLRLDTARACRDGLVWKVRDVPRLRRLRRRAGHREVTRGGSQAARPWRRMPWPRRVSLLNRSCRHLQLQTTARWGAQDPALCSIRRDGQTANHERLSAD